MHDRISILFIFIFLYLKIKIPFSDSEFPFLRFFSRFWYIIFLRDHNGNKAVQLFCAILVTIDFLIAFRHSITTLSVKNRLKVTKFGLADELLTSLNFQPVFIWVF